MALVLRFGTVVKCWVVGAFRPGFAAVFLLFYELKSAAPVDWPSGKAAMQPTVSIYTAAPGF